MIRIRPIKFVFPALALAGAYMLGVSQGGAQAGLTQSAPTWRAVMIDSKGDEWVMDTGLTLEDCNATASGLQSAWACEREDVIDRRGNAL